MEDSVFQELRQAVLSYDEEAARRAAEKALQLKVDPYKAITQGMAPAIKEVGDRFEAGDAFLPELMMAADAMSAAVKILEKQMTRQQVDSMRKGRIVLGTIKGDVHNIGKNIVGIMLQAAGYEIVDLGIDVDPSKFADRALESKADIIGVSALMTFTAVNMEMVSKYLESEGNRAEFKLLFGGGPLTEEWAAEMGADAYAIDAVKAVSVVDEMMKSVRPQKA